MPEKQEKVQLATKEDFGNYFREFKKIHSNILKSKYGYDVKVFVSRQQGSIIFFTFKEGINDIFSYRVIDGRIGAALSEIPQKAFAGNLKGIHFGGTNIIREDNRLIFIKGDNTKNVWTLEVAREDAQREVNVIKAILQRNKIRHGE